MSSTYTEKQWEEEMREMQFCGKHPAFGSCNLECPSCHEIGFYGPREIKSEDRKYRACKWCGFWQEAAGKVFDDRGGDSYPGAIFSHPKCGAEKFWGTADRPSYCEECRSDLTNEGAHRDDLTFKPTIGKMDQIHQNIQRIRDLL